MENIGQKLSPLNEKLVPRQSTKIFTFRVKSSDSIDYIYIKVNILKYCTCKILSKSLRKCKET